MKSSLGTACFCAVIIPFISLAQIQPEKVLDTVIILHRESHTINVSKISEQRLFENVGGNLAEQISREAGITLKQVGATVAKPVIEGLSNNRILIVNNGVRHESHDWSDDHAPEIAIGIPTEINIVKGAQSVRYGSGALGGVIIINPKPLSYDKFVKGSMQLLGNSNSSRTALSGYLQGSNENNLAWRLQANAQSSGDYRTAEYVVNNTGIRELGYTGEIEFKRNRWRSYMLVSGFHNEMGIFYGASTSNTDDFQDRLKLGRPIDYYPYSYDITAPKHLVDHYLIKNKTEFKIKDHQKLEVLIAYQYNERKEFDIRRLERTTIPTQHTQLTALNTELVWKNNPFRYWTVEVGLNHQRKENENVPGTGTVPTIPNFVSNNYAAFFISEYKRRKIKLDFGARLYRQMINSIGYDVYGELYGSERTFSSFSYNGGLRYALGKHFSMLLNAGFGLRTPEPYELYINGKQHGIPIYYLGDQHLNPEKGLKTVGKLAYDSDRFNAAISAFTQSINGFIYSIPSGDFRWLISGPSAVFRFVQSNALFRGGDLEVDYSFHKNLKYFGSASLVLANDKDTRMPLPQIPPFNAYQSLQWTIPNTVLELFYFKIEHQYFSKQTRYRPEFELMPDTPDAYNLIGLKVGGEIKLDKKRTVQLFLGVDNLTNNLYRNYTDRLRFFLHGKGLDIQFKTQFNF